MNLPSHLARSQTFIVSTIAVFALLHSTANAFQECMATLKDPHGSVVVSCDGGTKVTLKGGEHFLAEPRPDGWTVYLKSGCDGFIEKKVALQLLPNEPLMKFNYDAGEKEWRKLQSKRVTENDEIASQAKGHGVDYNKTLVRASEGNLEALAQFFSLAQFMDGAAAEGYFPEAWELFHVVGDKTLAKFVRGLPLADQVGVRGTLIG
jgi:hypothetical protein